MTKMWPKNFVPGVDPPGFCGETFVAQCCTLIEIECHPGADDEDPVAASCILAMVMPTVLIDYDCRTLVESEVT